MIQKEKKYEYWLASITNLSDGKKLKLRNYLQSAERTYYIEETELNTLHFLSEKERTVILNAKKNLDPERILEELEKKGVGISLCFDSEYPKQLQNISERPYAIFYKGKLPDANQYSIGIVGARQCTPYGEKYAYEFAETLAKYQIQVISGLAKGIDGISQRGALMGGGHTFAVLGNGVDICYPRENIGLYHDIIEQGGGILSEFPLGTQPLGFQFPKRNRIISGLSKVLLVIEAREKSGSLITADMALEQGRDVYALPGPVNSVLSAGCNRLIWQGAGILLSPEQLLEELGVVSVEKEEKKQEIDEDVKKQKMQEKKKVLETEENLVYSSVGLYPKSANQIMEETGLQVSMVFQILSALQIQGLIREISKNYYIKA